MREHLQTPWMQNSESMVTTTHKITPSSNSLLGYRGGGFVEDLWRTSSSSNMRANLNLSINIDHGISLDFYIEVLGSNISNGTMICYKMNQNDSRTGTCTKMVYQALSVTRK